MNWDWKKWAVAALIRAVRTFAQTFVSMIAVGAAFKFYSGIDEKRAPEWMVKHHMEFIYRIYQDPKK